MPAVPGLYEGRQLMPPVFARETAVQLKRGFKLLQTEECFPLNEDAVKLVDFAEIRPGEQVLELGSGTGGLTFMAYLKERAAFFTGLELMAENCRLAEASLKLNAEVDAGVIEHIRFVEGDLKNLSQEMHGKFDCVLCNPPFFAVDTGRVSAKPLVAAAKWEIYCTFADVLTAAELALKPQGRLYLVTAAARNAAETALAQGWQIIRTEKFGERELIELTR